MNRFYLQRMKFALLLFLLTLGGNRQVVAQDVNFKIVDALVQESLKAKMERNVLQLLEAMTVSHDIRSKKISIKSGACTPEAMAELSKIWKTSHLVPVPANISAQLLKTKSGFQVRGIPVDIVEAEDSEKRQEITIDFNPIGTISSISISMDMHRYEKIMAEAEKSLPLDYERRQIIVDFIENFRTAYNRKDLDFLNAVYSDNALIITGRLVKEKPNSDGMFKSLGTSKVEYMRQTKQEYIKSLAGIFKRNKYLNIRFEDIEVMKHPKLHNIYSVTLKQHWQAGNYKDTGWLFLLIDFHDEDNPLIHVRTWQPEKNSQGQIITKREDVPNISTFLIKKPIIKSIRKKPVK